MRNRLITLLTLVTALVLVFWTPAEAAYMSWSALGSGMSGGSYIHVTSLARDGSGNLYAAGRFLTAGGVTVNHIAKWNGSSWSALSSGLYLPASGYGLVYSLVLDASGNVYAGGDFTMTTSSLTVNHIAKWNGSSWSALGSGMDGDVPALAMDAAGNLYAGGWFKHAGGVLVNYIAKWNGSSWSSLGSGIGAVDPYIGPTAVESLLWDNSSGNLYAGGYFSTAGSVGANHIASRVGHAPGHLESACASQGQPSRASPGN